MRVPTFNSFGIIIYEMLAGVSVHWRIADHDHDEAGAGSPPSILEARPEVGTGLSASDCEGSRQQPVDRFQTGGGIVRRIGRMRPVRVSRQSLPLRRNCCECPRHRDRGRP